MDHESEPAAMLEELKTRLHLWKAGALSATDPAKAVIELHCANLCGTVNDMVEDLIEQNKSGRISSQELEDIVIGHGHHRLIAARPSTGT